MVKNLVRFRQTLTKFYKNDFLEYVIFITKSCFLVNFTFFNGVHLRTEPCP